MYVKIGAPNIPIYLGCPILGLSSVQLQNSVSFVTDSTSVVHIDSDGGEEPAVTTDVMLSGIFLKIIT